MRHLGRIARTRLLIGASAAAILCTSGAALAQDKPAITIAPQPLAAALYEFGGKTGTQVIFPSSLATAKQSRGVAGESDERVALTQLLTGTGLGFRREGDVFVIVQQEGGGAPQDQSAAGGGAEVEELIVTAQKREEAIQDVPIAISAFTQKSLDEQKLEGGFDLLKAIPNVTFSKTNFTGYNFSIRGIGTQAVSATTDPGVAVSFNNTTLIVNRLFEQEYVDVERVEVLRGPQGTLYGRNATAGVINVISAKPRMGEAFGEVKFEGGNYNAQRIRGHVNVPIGNTLAVRGAFAMTKRDGYGYNEFDGSDVDDRDLWTGRVTVGWEPTDAVRVNLMWEHFEEDDKRVRTSKQLCHRDLGDIDNGSGGLFDVTRYRNASLSQGCDAGSLYADEAYGMPNGASLPYVGALYHAIYEGAVGLGAQLGGANAAYGLGGNPWHPSQWATPGVAPADLPCAEVANHIFMFPVDVCNPDVYGGAMQSRDLRSIYSTIEPTYRAKSDVFDLSFDLDLTDSLTLSSQTVFAKDDYYASQDYNRFPSNPIWTDSSEACGIGGEFVLMVNCSSNPTSGVGSFAGGFYRDLSPGGVICDPQLGCSNTLVVQDLSTAKSTQYNQEFRLSSNFDAKFNFSAGVNFTKFKTDNDYFVFANGFTHLLNFWPFNYHHRGCGQPDAVLCRYVDPNPLESINGEGHNYFRSSNPYELTSSAAFGELYWQATDTLKVTAGMRFTWDRKAFTPVPSQLLLADYREIRASGGGGPLPGAGPEACTQATNPVDCPLSGTAPGGRGVVAEPDIVQEWREPTGRLVVDWKPTLPFTDETMVYASLARGYKGGGANPPSIAAPARYIFDKASGGSGDVFDAEYVNAFEVGAKNTLIGGALVLNASAFYYDYADYQVSQILDRRAVNDNFDAELWGLELEWVFSPTRNLRFNGAFGHLDTQIADGEESIDIMDRADGGRRHFVSSDPDTLYPDGFDDWVVVQPWIASAANCVVPRQLIEANVAAFAQGISGRSYNEYCPGGNLGGGTGGVFNPPYVDENGVAHSNGAPFYSITGDAPNGGAGFAKDLSGNELPNAPHWTASVGAQYTMPLPGGWDATVRGDFYWQSQSFWRVYNSQYDKLRAWTNANLSLWVENPDWGVTAEVYVKNVFDEAPITGAFLNSEDSGLTTNVFTLDPRLVGVSVRKSF